MWAPVRFECRTALPRGLNKRALEGVSCSTSALDDSRVAAIGQQGLSPRCSAPPCCAARPPRRARNPPCAPDRIGCRGTRRAPRVAARGAPSRGVWCNAPCAAHSGRPAPRAASRRRRHRAAVRSLPSRACAASCCLTRRRGFATQLHGFPLLKRAAGSAVPAPGCTPALASAFVRTCAHASMAAAAASAAAGVCAGAAHDQAAAAACARSRAQRGASSRTACAAATALGNGTVRRWQPRGRGAARTSPHACAWLLVASLLTLCATAQELDLTFAYSTLDQDYLPITPRPRPGVRCQASTNARCRQTLTLPFPKLAGGTRL